MMGKYPRTPHLPWSEGFTEDDKRLADVAHFKGKTVGFFEKLDGENCVFSREACHARSLDGPVKPWQSYRTSQWAQMAVDIPMGMEICMEDLYAVHSIILRQEDIVGLSPMVNCRIMNIFQNTQREFPIHAV